MGWACGKNRSDWELFGAERTRWVWGSNRSYGGDYLGLKGLVGSGIRTGTIWGCLGLMGLAEMGLEEEDQRLGTVWG